MAFRTALVVRATNKEVVSTYRSFQSGRGMPRVVRAPADEVFHAFKGVSAACTSCSGVAENVHCMSITRFHVRYTCGGAKCWLRVLKETYWKWKIAASGLRRAMYRNVSCSVRRLRPIFWITVHAVVSFTIWAAIVLIFCRTPEINWHLRSGTPPARGLPQP